MNTAQRIVALLASLATTTAVSHAQLVSASADFDSSTIIPQAPPTTFPANAQTDPSSATRLFLDTAETIAAPVGTTLWLVADVSGNGFPTGQATTAQIQDIIAGIGDDRLFFTGTVDGDLLGSQAGKYQKFGINVPSEFETANIGLVLWNNANQNGTIGDAGDQYGFFSFGVVPPPAIGNAEYLITGNVHGDQNLVTVVPEPAEVGIAVGMLCLAGALTSRAAKRRGRQAA